MKAQSYLDEPTRWWHWAALIAICLAPLGAVMTCAALAFAA
jgi:hypothetical protein